MQLNYLRHILEKPCKKRMPVKSLVKDQIHSMICITTAPDSIPQFIRKFGNAVQDAGYDSYLAQKEEELTVTNQTRRIDS